MIVIMQKKKKALITVADFSRTGEIVSVLRIGSSPETYPTASTLWLGSGREGKGGVGLFSGSAAAAEGRAKRRGEESVQ